MSKQNYKQLSHHYYYYCNITLSGFIDGVALFRLFLQREFSDENIEFWLACEDYKKIIDPEKLRMRAKQIYTDFVALQSSKEVNYSSCEIQLKS